MAKLKYNIDTFVNYRPTYLFLENINDVLNYVLKPKQPERRESQHHTFHKSTSF